MELELSKFALTEILRKEFSSIPPDHEVSDVTACRDSPVLVIHTELKRRVVEYK